MGGAGVEVLAHAQTVTCMRCLSASHCGVQGRGGGESGEGAGARVQVLSDAQTVMCVRVGLCYRRKASACSAVKRLNAGNQVGRHGRLAAVD